MNNLQKGLNLKKTLDYHMGSVSMQPHPMVHSAVTCPGFLEERWKEEKRLIGGKISVIS